MLKAVDVLKAVMVAALLTISSSVWAAVDWTPYLKEMKDECDFFVEDIISEALGDGNRHHMPKALQPSVASYSHTQSTTDVRLKNAIAFGQPITRIVVGTTDDDTFTTVYFANADFVKIKPQFTVYVDGKDHAIGGKPQAWGMVYTETGETDEDGEPEMDVSYTPILPQQLKKGAGTFDAILNVHENGWRYRTEAVYASLNFDTKAKSVSCAYSI